MHLPCAIRRAAAQVWKPAGKDPSDDEKLVRPMVFREYLCAPA